MAVLTSAIRKSVFGRFPSGIWLMAALNMLLTMGWSASGPFVALYLHNERALPMSAVGAIFLAGGLCTGGTNLVGGMLSDRFGRRRLMISVGAASTLALAAMALLIGLSAALWMIIPVYILSRSLNGTIHPTVGAIVADLAPRDRLAECYAVVRTGDNVGFAIGPAIGGYLAGVVSYGWLFSISAFAMLLVIVLVFILLRETFGGAARGVNLRSTIAVGRDKQFLVFAIVSILLVLSIGHLGSTLSVFAVDRVGLTEAQYGLLLTTNGLMVVAFQYPVTRLVSRLSRSTGLVLGSLFYVAGWTAMGWISGFNMAVMAVVIITMGEVTLAPISSAVVAESAPADKRGRYMGFFTLSQTLGNSTAPLFGGVLLDTFPSEPRFLWGIIGSVGLVAAFGFYLWGRLRRRPAPLAVPN